GLLLDEVRLLLRREHEIPVALLLRGERSEYPAAHTEVGRPHVRALFGTFQAESNPAKIRWSHGGLISRVWHSGGVCPAFAEALNQRGDVVKPAPKTILRPCPNRGVSCVNVMTEIPNEIH